MGGSCSREIQAVRVESGGTQKEEASSSEWHDAASKYVAEAVPGGDGGAAAAVPQTVLRSELASLEATWAAEVQQLAARLESKDHEVQQLVDLLKMKDEQIWSWLNKSSEAVMSQSAGAGEPKAAPPPALLVPSESVDALAEISKQRMSFAAVAAAALEREEAEAAEAAWEAISKSTPTLGSDGGAENVAQIDEVGLARFEEEMLQLTANAAKVHQQHEAAPAVAETFEAGEHTWRHTSTCVDGALWSQGTDAQHMFKGYILLRGVRAAALFDALLRPEALRTLLPTVLKDAHKVKEAAAASEETRGFGSDRIDTTNEMWKAVIHPAFSWHTRELTCWRAVRRRLQKRTFLMAMRNAPAHSGGTPKKSPLATAWSRPKPANLIGYNGVLVTEVEGVGARVCFVWCAELPGNALSVRKLKMTLSHFPQLAHSLISHAREYAPSEASRRAEVVDTSGNGIVDTLSIDTTGDGVVDVMIPLKQLQSASKKSSARPGTRTQWSGVGSVERGTSNVSGKSGASSRPSLMPQPLYVQSMNNLSEPSYNAAGGRRSIREHEDDRDFFLSGALNFFRGL